MFIEWLLKAENKRFITLKAFNKSFTTNYAFKVSGNLPGQKYTRGEIYQES